MTFAMAYSRSDRATHSSWSFWNSALNASNGLPFFWALARSALVLSLVPKATVQAVIRPRSATMKPKEVHPAWPWPLAPVNV